MKTVPVGHNKVALVDDEDYERVSVSVWHARRDYSTTQDLWYVQRHIRRPSGIRGTERLHSFILTTSSRIDHIDGNGLNNQKSNLRIASNSQNMANSRVRRHTSRFKGVSFYKRYGSWHVEIQCNKVRHSIGYFANEVDAALAYDSAAVEYFGAFARTNASLGLI